jgi:hypothetical protein
MSPRGTAGQIGALALAALSIGGWAGAQEPRKPSPGPATVAAKSVPALLDALAETRDDAAREALLLSLERLPIADLRAQIARRAGGTRTDEDRCAAIEALGRCGGSSDLDLMLATAAGAAVLDGEDRVSASLEHAAGRLLERDESTCVRIAARIAECPPALRDALFAAVAAREGPASLRFFAQVARESTSLAPLALAHLARGGSRAARPIEEEVLHVVRSILSDPGSPALPEAALAAGHLEDYASIPRLIDLLDDAHPSVRANAEWSLRTLSGLDLLGGADRWRAWYRIEERWRRSDWPRIERELASGEKGRVASALDAIAGKRCRRHELARSVSRLLDDPDPEIVELACEALGQLRSSTVHDELEACRGSASPAVREAAERALAAGSR